MNDLLGKTSLCAPLVKKIKNEKNPCQRSTTSQAILTASNANPSAFSSPQRERSLPAFIPSAPSKGISGRRGQRTSSSASTDLLNPSPAVNRGTGPFPVHQNPLQDVSLKPDEAADLNERVRHRREHSLGPVDAQPSQELSLKQQETLGKSSACEGRKREKYRDQFDEIPIAVSEDVSAWTGATERPRGPSSCPPHRPGTQAQGGPSLVEWSGEEEHFKTQRCASTLSSRLASEQPNPLISGETRQSFPGPLILPRPPALPGIVGRQEADSALLHLQNSFSKTAAQRNFNSSITYAAVNLNDNVVSGKKHNFFGINSCYLHG